MQKEEELSHTDAAPHYSIGHVDDSLWDIQKEFTSSDQSVWDFFQSVAEEIGCVFICDPFSRTINVFDIQDHCTNTEYHDKKDSDGNYVNDHNKRHVIDGVCTICGAKAETGYGLNSAVFVDTTNLAQEIEDSIDTNQVKNCYKITGGDDTVTNLIQQRLIGNSNYIWCIGKEQLSEMSAALREKWNSYQELVAGYQNSFKNLWTNYDATVDDILYLQSGRMPIVEGIPSTEDAAAYCKQIYEDILDKISYGCVASKKTTLKKLSKDILDYANTLCPTGYAVKYQTDENGEDKVRAISTSVVTGAINLWGGYFYVYLKNYPDPEDSTKDKYFYSPTEERILAVKCGDQSFQFTTINGEKVYTNDYYLYLKKMMDIEFANLDVTYEPKYYMDTTEEKKHLYDSDYYKNYFGGICNKCHKHNIFHSKCEDCGSTDVQEGFSINRLDGFLEGYRNATVILNELNSTVTDSNIHYQIIADNSVSTVSPTTLFQELTAKYNTMADYIEELIAQYTAKVEIDKELQGAYLAQINAINTICNLKKYLGDELYLEFISFKREQTYNNSNFTSETVDEATLMKNVDELIKYAQEDIAKSCLFSHTITIQMGNLLSMVKYADVFDAFVLGNYIRVRINGQDVKVRIVSISLDFDNIENSEVTFADATVVTSEARKLGSTIEKASSIATSYDYTQKQVSQNTATTIEFQKMMNDGLSMTQTHIMNSENEEVSMDTHGLIARQYDSDTGTYGNFQSRLNSRGLIFTTNNWADICTAVGQIVWNNEVKTGIIAQYLVGDMILGKNLSITNSSGNYTINDNGFKMSNGGKYIEMNPSKPYIKAYNGSTTVLDFNSNGDGKLKITGDIVANSLTLGSNASIDYDKLTDVPDFVEKGKTIGTYGDGSTGMSISTDGLLKASNAVIYGKIYAKDGEFSGTLDVQGKGNIAGWQIKKDYLYTKGNTYITQIGTIIHDDYVIDNTNFQMSMYNGKLICGLDNGDALFPNTEKAYSDISAAGVYVKNNAKLDDYIFAADTKNMIITMGAPTTFNKNASVSFNASTTLNASATFNANTTINAVSYHNENAVFRKAVFMDMNQYIWYTWSENNKDVNRRMFGLTSNHSLHIGDPDNNYVATNCLIHASNIYKSTSGGNTSLSDKRYKTDVSEIQKAQDFIMSLNPVKYKYTDGTSNRYHFGFLADDVEKSLQDTTGDAGVFVKYSISDETKFDMNNPDTYVCGLRYEEIIAPLVQTIQSQQQQIEELQKKMGELL